MQSQLHFVNDEPANVRFLRFIEQNPQVYTMFKKIAFECINAGCTKLGGKMIYEVMRYQTFTQVNKMDWDKYRLNNNYTCRLVRMFIKEYPQHENKFELRMIKAV